MAPEARAFDPLAAFRFTVTGGDYLTAGIQLGFSRVSGLGGEIGVKEWRQLTDPSTPVKLPTEATYGDVTLERGVDTNGALKTWWENTRSYAANGVGTLPRFTISIAANARPGGATGKWELYAAWPRKITWGDLDANTSGVLIESLVLANEGVTRL